MSKVKKVVAMENINLLTLTEKVNNFAAKNNLEVSENGVRFVQMTLRHHVHHFPTNIPFVAAVKKCGEKQVVFFVKRTKFAVIDDIDISSETKIGKSFEIDGVRYELKDTINGYPRYKPSV